MNQKRRPVAKKKRSGWMVLLKVVLIILFLILALFGGATVGYVVLGKQDLGSVMDIATWKHVFDLVFAP